MIFFFLRALLNSFDVKDKIDSSRGPPYIWGTFVVQVLILAGRLIIKGEVQGWRRERQPFGHGQWNSLRTRTTLGTADVESVEFLNSTVAYPVKGFSEFKIDSINLHSLVQLFAYVMKDWSNWAVVDLSLKNPNCLNLVLCCGWFDWFFLLLLFCFCFCFYWKLSHKI